MRDAELSSIIESGDNLEVDGLLGKCRGVLPQSEFFKPGRRTNHRRFVARARHGIAGERIPVPMAIKSFVAKWFRRHLWMADFGSLSPSDQAARVVIAARCVSPTAKPMVFAAHHTS